MDWAVAVDGYCERTGPGLWAEPVNAATNAAFLIAAAVMWRRTADMPLGRWLSAVLCAIGIGSLLFHTFAQGWAAVADTTPIGGFILLYIYAANRTFWAMPIWAAVSGVAAYVPWTIALTPVFGALPFFDVSAFYWPVPLLILLYAAALRRWAPRTARGLALGAAVLVVSLIFRSLDTTLCDRLPLGTHFVWHLLNAAMLGWMIEVWRRHALEGARVRR